MPPRRFAPFVHLCTTLLLAASPAAAQQPAFDHAAFDRILDRHVSAAGIDYEALQADRTPLDRYLAALAEIDSSTFDRWPRDEQIAYLINAYNAHVLVGVIDHYPIRRSLRPSAIIRPANSVWQIPGFFDGIRRGAAGRDLTLDEIEHEWLRARLREPRIHFALVCAARSCPPLRPEAYVAGRLEQQLDEQASLFFNDRAANQFDPRRRAVRLSSILRWFGEDFEAFAPSQGFNGNRTERGVLAFAARFLPDETGRWLRDGRYRITYIEYDWSLNDAR